MRTDLTRALRRSTPLLGLLMALSQVGCLFDGDNDDDDDRPTRPGELGEGKFRYICVGDSDPFCDEGFVAATFPERFAVGGRFDLEFEPAVGFFPEGEVVPRVIAPATSSVATQGMTFMFLREGYAAFLARDNEGDVIDVRHLYAYPIDRIAITSGDSEDLAKLDLEAGEEKPVSAIPQDGFRSTLAGSLDYTWTVDDPTIAEVTTADLDFDVAVRGLTQGETTLRVSAVGFEQTLTLRVSAFGDTDAETETATTGETGAAETTAAGSTGGDDSDTDAGTDTDATTGATE